MHYIFEKLLFENVIFSILYEIACLMNLQMNNFGMKQNVLFFFKAVINLDIFFIVYWIVGARSCFLLTSVSFIIPLVLLRAAGRQKEE